MQEIFEISRILFLAALAFLVAIFLTTILSHFLFRYRLGKQIRLEGAPIYNQLHQKKEGTPTMGGILVWLTTLILALVFWALSKLGLDSVVGKLDFLGGQIGRAQTWLPLGVLVASAVVGLGDDLLGIFKIGPKGGGLKMRHRILVYAAIALFGAW